MLNIDWTDQKPRVATAEDCRATWGGGENGKYFRCFLCGHSFQVGDVWRWVYTPRGNPLVCASCDGPDVVERWEAARQEARTRFWWLWRRD